MGVTPGPGRRYHGQGFSLAPEMPELKEAIRRVVLVFHPKNKQFKNRKRVRVKFNYQLPLT